MHDLGFVCALKSVCHPFILKYHYRPKQDMTKQDLRDVHYVAGVVS